MRCLYFDSRVRAVLFLGIIVALLGVFGGGGVALYALHNFPERKVLMVVAFKNLAFFSAVFGAILLYLLFATSTERSGDTILNTTDGSSDGE